MTCSNGSAAAAWASCDSRSVSLSVAYLVAALRPFVFNFILQFKKELWQIVESSSRCADLCCNWRLQNIFLRDKKLQVVTVIVQDFEKNVRFSEILSMSKFPHYTNTVRLLTHVICKPTHFFFHTFIATMSYSLQTSFNRAMKDWPDKYHVWGTPTRSPSRSNSR